jgi:hypothetical protein
VSLLPELLLLSELPLLLLEQAARDRTMTRARSSARSFPYFFIWILIPFKLFPEQPVSFSVCSGAL